MVIVLVTAAHVYILFSNTNRKYDLNENITTYLSFLSFTFLIRDKQIETRLPGPSTRSKTKLKILYRRRKEGRKEGR
jgi:hypothetical protein